MCPSSDFCYDARGAVQIAAPTRSNGFSPLSGSLDSAKFFAGSLTRPAKGASKGRTSGQLFSAASRVHLSRPTRLGSPGYGLSSAPTRDKCTRDDAELAGCKSPTAAALSPLLEAKLASGATLGGSAGRPCSVGLAVASLFEKKKEGGPCEHHTVTLS